ncbi:GGDEF domain-containing protein [Paenibacillus dakarensis]|uniref:GGDEF domain-containing protein n=1 Tax=Paenibacillus dakarensis TaxID=1527293 RepID=UPI0006D53BEF|nr:GGDEF domain-containing protein [Paenibacillus dakarensis]
MSELTVPSAFSIFGVSAICAAYLAVLMLVMCLLIYSKQRKKAYVYMAAAFFFIMTYESLNIHQAFSGQALFKDWLRPLQLYSFVLLNLSVLMLYRRVRQARSRLAALSGVLLTIPLLIPDSANPLWTSLYLDLFEWTVIYISYTKISTRIGQQIKYVVGLTIYALWAVLSTIQRYYLLAEDQEWLRATISILPIPFYSIIFFILIQRIIELMQSIYRSSITDGLTGLYNRRYFMKNLHHYAAQQLKISAIFCDIDNFKKLNDTEGHARADEVLKQVSDILEEELEGIGITGRYGGEELVALVVSRGIRTSQVAEKIRSRVAEETTVTVSVGFSALRKGMNGDMLMKQADEAMYISKTSGKNRVTDYHSKASRFPVPKEPADDYI